jgi:hypothetical protein
VLVSDMVNITDVPKLFYGKSIEVCTGPDSLRVVVFQQYYTALSTEYTSERNFYSISEVQRAKTPFKHRT